MANNQVIVEGILEEILFSEFGHLQEGVLGVITPNRVFGPKDEAYHTRVMINQKNGKFSPDLIGTMPIGCTGKKIKYISVHSNLANKSIISEEVYINGKLVLDYTVVKQRS